jgi:cytochrome d ubiquinol oxidase subunit I
MDALALARLQFAVTTVYHFFFVPLTLGLSLLVALMETAYVRTGDDVYKQMTKFWGKLFLINFAMGVVTGIVMEFQFGMNWSEYSRFVGDIFGVPLAIEALLAFFLESTFLGIWIFGWAVLPKGLHLLAIWLVALGSNLSAFWILVANSWMQHPVGYTLRNGRAEMTDFWALLTNSYLWVQFPHVLFAGITTAAFFVLGISAYHLRKGSKGHDLFRRSFNWAVVYALVGSILVSFVGHTQAQFLREAQPMKLAAAEAVWETEQPAALSLLTIGTLSGREEVFSIRLPTALSLLACDNLTCEVQGIHNLQAEYEQIYGPGDYIPPIAITYWSFRGMLTSGVVMVLLSLCGLYLVLRRKVEKARWFLYLLPWAMVLPFLSNSAGWMMAELGRQPWIVFGVMRTEAGVSVVVSAGTVLLSLVFFILLYGALIVADIYLLAKYARKEPAPPEESPALVVAGAEGEV